MKMTILTGLGACAALAITAAVAVPTVPRAQGSAPHYEFDPSWPKPFPAKWVNGGLGGHCVDANDHVLILNRQDVLAADLNAGQSAPAMIELDPAGNVVNTWGDPKLMDTRLHSCHFDKDDNIWVASAPSGMVQKYSHDGSKLLLQIGKKGVFDTSDGTEKGRPLNSNAAVFHTPSSISVDRGNGDVYVSDGDNEKSNRRIAVMDATGKFLRQWQPEGFQTVHCMTIGNDGLVYVCNRRSSKVHVFDKMGKEQRVIAVPWMPVSAPAMGKVEETGGSAVAIAFSHDANQRYMFVVNQNSSQIEIIERASGKNVGSFGRAGPYPGELNQAHGIATDSKGNITISENRGRRVQRFKLVGG